MADLIRNTLVTTPDHTPLLSMGTEARRIMRDLPDILLRSMDISVDILAISRITHGIMATTATTDIMGITRTRDITVTMSIMLITGITDTIHIMGITHIMGMVDATGITDGSMVATLGIMDMADITMRDVVMGTIMNVDISTRQDTSVLVEVGSPFIVPKDRDPELPGIFRRRELRLPGLTPIMTERSQRTRF